jgi:O-antigen/teichoic acid export membrane protein
VDSANAFLQGACAMSCWVIGMFFLRYWRASRERLFLFFLAAFWMFALNWIGLILLNPADDTRHWFYVTRLVAFLLIIAGVIDKNRRSR